MQQEDPMGRDWYGWDDDLDLDEVFDQNRGLWRLSSRATNEHVATFSHNGIIKIVAEIDEIEVYGFTDPAKPPKSAIIGRVLRSGPIWQALIGAEVDSHRNPVTYIPDPGQVGPRPCACGCGGRTTGRSQWISGHDQRAIHERITEQWGGTLGFVRWYDEKYRSGS